ncbi:putative tetratricopeptide-like helical domain superfamily [Dioscorea sansibarensis]
MGKIGSGWPYSLIAHLSHHDLLHSHVAVVVIPRVLRACAKLSDLQTGKALHNRITRSSLDSDAFISTALISMYSKCGRTDLARRVFDRMSERDLVVWNSIISGYACLGLLEDAMDLFDLMKSSGTKPDLVTWNALISGFSRVGNVQMVLDLFSLMQVDGIKPDVFSWTSVISGLVGNFQYKTALQVFKQMVVARVHPNSVTISSILPACAIATDLRHGKEMHAHSLVIGATDDLHVNSALIDMYAKCGLISDAGLIFNSMSERNSVSWNSMIFGYANHGYCEEAIKLFYRMEDEGVRLDHLTFTAVFTACSNAGMVETGKDLFDMMQTRHGIKPRLEHYACMVDLLGRAGKLVEAHEFIKNMPVEPDCFVWGALLGASRKHGDVALAEIAVSHLTELEPKSVGSGKLLSNVLADAGHWRDAAEIKRNMKRRKLRGYLGCSWML